MDNIIYYTRSITSSVSCRWPDFGELGFIMFIMWSHLNRVDASCSFLCTRKGRLMDILTFCEQHCSELGTFWGEVTEQSESTHFWKSWRPLGRATAPKLLCSPITFSFPTMRQKQQKLSFLGFFSKDLLSPMVISMKPHGVAQAKPSVLFSNTDVNRHRPSCTAHPQFCTEPICDSAQNLMQLTGCYQQKE